MREARKKFIYFSASKTLLRKFCTLGFFFIRASKSSRNYLASYPLQPTPFHFDLNFYPVKKTWAHFFKMEPVPTTTGRLNLELFRWGFPNKFVRNGLPLRREESECWKCRWSGIKYDFYLDRIPLQHCRQLALLVGSDLFLTVLLEKFDLLLANIPQILHYFDRQKSVNTIRRKKINHGPASQQAKRGPEPNPKGWAVEIWW